MVISNKQLYELVKIENTLLENKKFFNEFLILNNIVEDLIQQRDLVNKKNYARIKEKRANNPNYARSKKEIQNKEIAKQKRGVNNV